MRTLSFYESVLQIAPQYDVDNHIQNLDAEIQKSKNERFTSFSIRKQRNLLPVDFFSVILSQGTHSTNSWKGYPLYKSVFDLGIYSEIIQEIKPDTIVEFGSGNGSSAIWFSDVCQSLGLNTKVVSYDIQKVNQQNPNVSFIQQDLRNKIVGTEMWEGKKILIEDCHVNTYSIIDQCDKHLNSGDYLVIEDSNELTKRNVIDQFMSLREDKYVVDNYYIDFYGTNMTSCQNSIFKIL
jgi:cephalosporin hydroxylase